MVCEAWSAILNSGRHSGRAGEATNQAGNRASLRRIPYSQHVAADLSSRRQGGGMEEIFRTIAGNVALGAELVATLLIAIGGIGAFARVVRMLAQRNAHVRTIKDIWLRLAGWILLALEFTLAADIVRTSISPTWEDLGKLAAIAAIRTVLSIFLERDLSTFEKERDDKASTETPRPAQA
jgi:uncharacterized membrane protein